MRDKLATISKWYVLALLVVCPPVGFYFAMKYYAGWVKKNIWFTVLVGLYFVAMVVGVVLVGLGR